MERLIERPEYMEAWIDTWSIRLNEKSIGDWGLEACLCAGQRQHGSEADCRNSGRAVHGGHIQSLDAE